jgi:hypothetical protein
MNLRLKFIRGEGGDEVPVKLQVSDSIIEIVPHGCRVGYTFAPDEPGPNAFAIVYIRHRFVKVTFGILYIIAGIFLFYIWRRGETAAVMTSSLGYIAALWGIRQIIVGNVKLFPTLVDFVTLLLYLIVITMAVRKWMFGSTRAPAPARQATCSDD